MAIGLVAAYNASRGQTVSKTITTLADVKAGNIAIMYGTSVAVYRQSEIRNSLKQCRDVIRELGFPKPVTVGNFHTVAINLDTGKHAAVIAANAAAAVIPVETSVTIAYSDTFDNAPSSTLNMGVTVDNLLNEFIDDILSTL